MLLQPLAPRPPPLWLQWKCHVYVSELDAAVAR